MDQVIHVDDDRPPLKHPNPDPPPSTYSTDEDAAYLRWIKEQEEIYERRRSLEPNPHIVHEGMQFI